MENQEIILKCIEDNPGLTQAQITHRLEIPQSTRKYHLLVLGKKIELFLKNYLKFIILKMVLMIN